MTSAARSAPHPAGAAGTRRHRGADGGTLPAAIVFDAVLAGAPAELVLHAAGEPHAIRCAAVSALGWALLGVWRERYYRRKPGGGHAVASVVRDWVALVSALAVLHAMTSESCSFLLLAGALLPAIPAAAARQAVVRRRLLAARRGGRALRRALVIGRAEAAEGLARHLARNTDHEFVVVGVCALGPADAVSAAPVAALLDEQPPADPSADSVPVLSAAQRLAADVVFVVPSPDLTGDRLRRLAWAVHGAGRPLVVLPGLAEVAPHRLDVTTLAGLTALHIAPPIRRGPAVALKSATDRVGAALLLILFAPLFLLVALAVRLDSPGSVLHRQTRVGQHRRPFTMWKFRSMVSNAEQLRHGLADANEHDGRQFKIRRDPRVTRVGRVLRRYSLDELPQLFNVLRGQMSLVGPRPPLPDEVAGYNEVELRRLNVRPGLTGLWQVSGRSDLSWDETVALDLRYVDNWSPSMDAAVFLRTFRAVFTGSGAY